MINQSPYTSPPIRSPNSLTQDLILGIDPGLGGALAFISKFAPPNLQKVYDMPTYVPQNGSKKKIDAEKIASIMTHYSERVAFAIVEEVGVMGGHEGTVSMFNFGFGAGILQGVLSTLLIPTFYVKPAVWKSLLGLGRNKEDSRKKATNLFPHSSDVFKRVKDDGRAEAALLAWFGLNRLTT
jgi:crossover junction endodeoxyribonuclease RuvC